NPLHFDPDFVRSLGRGEHPVNQGTLNFSYPLNALIDWLAGADAVARIIRYSCRFSGSVFEGDQVRVGGKVVEVDEQGCALVELWLYRNNDQKVLAGVAKVTKSSQYD
ncbi:MAG: MaoC family dehydratase, partial [Propionibacteriaceae bacterium]|nr:MaoC family dehydratase [Propionibacteriaceae bacterium]